MKKRAYEKPTCRVIVLKHKTNILVGSPYDATPPNEIPDYDDWFGARESDDDWDDEDVWDEDLEP